MTNDISMDKEKLCTVHEQIANKLYNDQNLRNTLEMLNVFHGLEENNLEKNSPGYVLLKTNIPMRITK